MNRRYNRLFFLLIFLLVSLSGFSQLSVSLIGFNSTCKGANNGYAIATASGGTPPYTFQWSPAGGTNDTTKLLPPGLYTVTVTDNSGFNITKSINILEEDEACVHIYTGITPNGDNNNDTWQIENIELFPLNKVTIFSRWGDTVWEETNYDNVNVVWKGTDQQNHPLLVGTYFYTIYFNGTRYSRGWVELTR